MAKLIEITKTIGDQPESKKIIAKDIDVNWAFMLQILIEQHIGLPWKIYKVELTEEDKHG